MADFHIPSDDEFDEEMEVPDKQSLFDRRKELPTQTNEHHRQSDQPKQENASTEITKQEHNKTTQLKPPEATATKVAVNVVSNTKVQSEGASTSSAPVSGTYAGYRIIVNRKQKGNPILKYVRNVPWEFDNIVPDYELGRCACALYLSVKYHNRFPEYIHTRLKELGKSYDLRVLLVQIDTKQQDISHELNQLAKICILADCTMILAFSLEEAGRYLELYKAYENKPPTEIMGRTKTDFLSQATEFLTSIKGVNKTDVTTLLSRFKTLKGVMEADLESLSMCPGIGPVKARRIISTFTTLFLRKTASPQKHSTAATEAAVQDMIDDLDDETDFGT